MTICLCPVFLGSNLPVRSCQHSSLPLQFWVALCLLGDRKEASWYSCSQALVLTSNPNTKFLEKKIKPIQLCPNHAVRTFWLLSFWKAQCNIWVTQTWELNSTDFIQRMTLLSHVWVSQTTTNGTSWCLFEYYQIFLFLLHLLQGMQNIHSSLQCAKITIKY